MSDFNKVMQAMQSVLGEQKQLQSELGSKRVEGVAGGGMVKVVADGNLQIQQIVLDPALLKQEDPELVGEMVRCAVNDAMEKARHEGAARMSQKLMSSEFLSRLSRDS